MGFFVSMKTRIRILYLAYGRAGLLCLGKLCDEIGVKPDEILCYTYDHVDNQPILKDLVNRKVEHSVAAIKSSETLARIRTFQPDLIVSMHYRHLVPAEVLKTASIGSFNLHPSLLPKYRGTFSALRAIINGEAITGITYHYMNEKFDDGNIILQRSVSIADTDTGFSLFHKLIDLGVEYFREAFEAVANNRVTGYPQIGEPSYYPRQVPWGGLIDRSWDEQKIERFIRALTFPGKPGPLLQIGGRLVEVKSMDHYREICS